MRGRRNRSGFGRTIIFQVKTKLQFYKKKAMIKSASMIFELVLCLL